MNDRPPSESSGSSASQPLLDETVRKKELAALSRRSSARARPQNARSGLPDFDAYLRDDDGFSPFFEHTRAMLEDETQQTLWREWAEQAPDTRHGGLTGLALSGGGIRSSTINLGILQVVHRIGLFRCIDYLSTVSGGGYVAASLSSCFSPPRTNADEGGGALDESPTDEAFRCVDEDFPYQHERGKPEPVAFLQLRNYSSFLAPRGLVDYLKFPALLVRGLVVNFLAILPWIIGAALVSRLGMRIDDGTVRWAWSAWEGWLFGATAFGPTLYAAAVFLALGILFPVVLRLEQKLPGRAQARDLTAPCESLMVLALIALALAAFVDFEPTALNLMGRSVDHPQAWTVGIAGGAGLVATFGHLFANRIKAFSGKLGLYLVALIGIGAFWLLYLLLCGWLLSEPDWWAAAFGALPVSVVLLAAVLLLAIYTNLFIDANGLSMHNFYRDRLADAFLFRVDKKRNSIEPNTDLRISGMSARVGPIHLVNTALNTQNLPTPFRKGRRAEPFFFSPLYSGSRITGYCRTTEIESMQRELSLSTAVATSGAAVSSNMGMQTNVALRFILSMLNIRLGYWVVNPMLADPLRRTLRLRATGFLGVGVVRFLQELTGRLGYDSSYVYLSDGGHIENLGLYELVRRQCRLIIAGDGECDPSYNFHGLTEALRLIQIDFGIRVEMDGLDEIRSGERQFARGKIFYPDGRFGYLIYLKSSLLGDDMVEATVSDDAYVTSPLRNDVRRYDELSYMARYRGDHPDFPHESTADQFFDETQFECYRALGYMIADRAFTGTQ
jgi:hypothetical protein